MVVTQTGFFPGRFTFNIPIFYSETINKASLFIHKYLKSFLLKLQQLDNKMQTLLSFKKERKLNC